MFKKDQVFEYKVRKLKFDDVLFKHSVTVKNNMPEYLCVRSNYFLFMDTNDYELIQVYQRFYIFK